MMNERSSLDGPRDIHERVEFIQFSITPVIPKLYKGNLFGDNLLVLQEERHEIMAEKIYRVNMTTLTVSSVGRSGKMESAWWQRLYFNHCGSGSETHGK